MKQFLLKFKALCIICLVMIIGGMNVHAANKITDIADIVSGQKYYICATTAGTDYYLKLASTLVSASVAGTAVTDKATANVFIFEGSGNTWSIKIDGTNNYLSLKNSKDNGKVQVVKSATNFTLSNVSKLIKIAKGSYMIQKNSQGNNFGSYSSNQTKVWLEPLEESGKSISISPSTSTVVKAPVKVTLTANPGATIYYTTNGDEPTTTSTKYTAPFEVTKSGTTVKALAVAEGAENVTDKATYTIKPDQPVFSDESKTFKDAFNVTLSLPESTDPTSTIHYAIGKDATAESPLYESPINISAEKDGAKVILHAVVVDQYGNVGMEKRCTYTKTTSFIFDFTGDWEGITPLKNNDDANAANVVAGKELKVGGIVMTATNGTSLTTCLYGTKNSHNLRVYTNGSITFTAPVGYNISEVTFNNNSAAFETTVGTYNKGTWTGNAHAVTFKATDLVKLNNATIKLVAAAATPLTLDEDADDTDTKIKANNGKTVDVKLTRSLKAGAWNTICLPFDVITEQIKNILKAEGMVREYADDDATAQTITFKKVEGNMKAGEPYLIKPTEDITSLAFEGVTITAIEGNLQGKAYGICGTLGKYTMKTDGTELFLNAAGKFVAPAAATNTMKGFRAYFMVPSGSSAAAININIDGETTGINSIETEATVNGKVYNLNGQYVGNSLNGLKKGIYVVNGKKVIK